MLLFALSNVSYFIHNCRVNKEHSVMLLFAVTGQFGRKRLYAPSCGQERIWVQSPQGALFHGTEKSYMSFIHLVQAESLVGSLVLEYLSIYTSASKRSHILCKCVG